MAAEADWVLVPAVEAEEPGGVAAQVGAAAPAVQVVCGRQANLAQQLAAGRVVAELEWVGLVVEAVRAVAVALGAAESESEERVVPAGRAVAPAGADLVVEAEPEEAEGLVAGLARQANPASGWRRQLCSREACWEGSRA